MSVIASDPLSVAVKGVSWLQTMTGCEPAHQGGYIELLWTWDREGHFTITPQVPGGGWQADPIVPAAERCPAGGEHTWGWHVEDGAGRPITPGVFCDECGARHPDDAQFPTRRHWETAGM